MEEVAFSVKSLHQRKLDHQRVAWVGASGASRQDACSLNRCNAWGRSALSLGTTRGEAAFKLL